MRTGDGESDAGPAEVSYERAHHHNTEGLVEKAVAETLVSVAKAGADVFFVPGTPMQDTMEALCSLALKVSDDSDLKQLSDMISRGASNESSDDKVFNKFLAAIEKVEAYKKRIEEAKALNKAIKDPEPKPAVYLGGLPYQLLAVTALGRPLITSSDLASISSKCKRWHKGLPNEDYFFPRNVLLVNKKTLEERPDEIESGIANWNHITREIHRPQRARFRQDVSKLINSRLQSAYKNSFGFDLQQIVQDQGLIHFHDCPPEPTNDR